MLCFFILFIYLFYFFFLFVVLSLFILFLTKHQSQTHPPLSTNYQSPTLPFFESFARSFENPFCDLLVCGKEIVVFSLPSFLRVWCGSNDFLELRFRFMLWNFHEIMFSSLWKIQSCWRKVWRETQWLAYGDDGAEKVSLYCKGCIQ